MRRWNPRSAVESHDSGSMWFVPVLDRTVETAYEFPAGRALARIADPQWLGVERVAAVASGEGRGNP